MATTHQDTNVNQLVINKMTKQEYDNLSQVSDTELYLVEEQVDSVVTQNSTNPVQSGAVYEAIQDIGGNINDGTTIFAKNQVIIGTTSANQSANQTITLPNDVVMCKMLENRALASYATPITRFKYIEDHGWVDMDRSDIQYNEGTGEWTGTFVSLDITEGEYYYDMDNKAVFVADENSEMQDVTSTVVIQDDINKLYCDVDTNQLYRYDGSNYVAIEDTSKAPNYPTFSTAATRENLLGNGESTPTLWGKVKKWFTDLKAVAFTGSYNDLTDKLQNATTSSAGLMSASDKALINSLSITELTNITVTWLNNFSGTIRVFQYGKILQVYITISSTQDVSINSRICYLNITSTYSTFYTGGILRSPTADPIGIFTSSQNSNLTFYIAQIYRTGNTYTGSMLIII